LCCAFTDVVSSCLLPSMENGKWLQAVVIQVLLSQLLALCSYWCCLFPSAMHHGKWQMVASSSDSSFVVTANLCCAH
jgi:hypothetical protein